MPCGVHPSGYSILSHFTCAKVNVGIHRNILGASHLTGAVARLLASPVGILMGFRFATRTVGVVSQPLGVRLADPCYFRGPLQRWKAVLRALVVGVLERAFSHIQPLSCHACIGCNVTGTSRFGTRPLPSCKANSGCS